MKIFSILLLLSCLTSNAQSDTLNQRDQSGNRQGWWIVLLDENWEKVSDNDKACYTRYAFFINDGNLYPMARWGKKGFTLERNGKPIQAKAGDQILLDGTYEWFDSKGRLLSTHVLKNGIYQDYKFYYKNGALRGGYDYNKQCGPTPQDYCMYGCGKDGNIKWKGSMGRDESGKPINKE